MSEDNKGVTYSFDVCSKCKSVCCRDARPPLSKSREKILKKDLKARSIDSTESFVREKYTYPAFDEDYLCRLFNKETGKCSVHTVKPETCRAGPVTFDINFKTKKIEWFLKKESLCAYAGVLFRDKTALAAHLDVAKKELTRLICELDADDLRVIIKIDEPETFKIGEDNLPPEVIKKMNLI